MAAEQQTQTPKAPRTFTLSGRALTCYGAGRDIGASGAYQASGENLRRLKTHQAAQLGALKRQLLEHPTYPIPDDHPLREAIEQLPILADGLENVAQQFESEASKLQTRGSQAMGSLAAQDEAQEARWRPPWRAWGMLTLAITVATMVSSMASTWFAIYAIRAGW